MLRTVLKLMLAIFLIVQGCGLAFGHDGHSARMHCHHVDEHGKPIRMPCCPHGCPSTGDACSAWAIAMIALPLSVLRSVEGGADPPKTAETSLELTRSVPPTRPPIV
jgi:hypothetical protein